MTSLKILKYFFKKIKIWFLFSILFSCIIFAQIPDTNDYFPLHVGDKWWYSNLGIYPTYRYVEITGTKLIGDTTYFVMDSTDLYRKDSIGNVYKRINGIDQLFFKLDAKMDEKWYINDKWGIFYMKYWGDRFDFVAPFGILKNCKSYSYNIYYPQISDRGKSYLLAPGIGICKSIFDPNIEVINSISRAFVDKKFFGGTFSVHVFTMTSGGFILRSEQNISLLPIFWISFNTNIDSNNIQSKFKVISKKIGEIEVSMKIKNSGYNTIAYELYPSNEFPPSDTITIKILGDIIDIYGEGFDGNGNGIYEGSPTDDYIKTFYTKEITGINDVSKLPINFSLFPNYPNPFNNETTIKFSIPEKGMVSPIAYNLDC